MKKKIIGVIALLIAGIIYFVFYHTRNTYTTVPLDADAIILIDAKKVKRQYISDLLTHPSAWFKKGPENSAFLNDSGIVIPDFFQFFHLKNSSLTEWYSIFDLKDQQQFLKFLQSQKFKKLSENVFRKDHAFIMVYDNLCIAGTSKIGLESIHKQVFKLSQKNILDAASLVDKGIGSIIFNDGKSSYNLYIDLNSDEMEFRTNSNFYDSEPIIAKLLKTKSFIETELDSENMRLLSSVFPFKNLGDAKVDYLKANADLQQVNDTIITYEYDDNFNEIEKNTVRKIVQPAYVVSLHSSDPEKTAQYFQDKKWINAQRQFVVIPFQPNVIEKKKNDFEIRSTGKSIQPSLRMNENYIFITNNELLYSHLKSFTLREKKIISDIDYIFYGHKDQDYYVKLKFKESELPLVLRW
ncbi:hypothetical protein SAMN05421856_10684 [Chryseobacterium taichungense]|uniref:Uncharacterized protein n=1 Tax=Chryseobacterium taichungense TaxID=295069 RepID=A0A1H8AUC7_9FLAO|nr:hypothetical protein [Chryseobacterium taichungense]SEM74352.1 hypothetical protein SAMN05421856_10684 [Chryseobacterium taichungense]